MYVKAFYIHCVIYWSKTWWGRKFMDLMELTFLHTRCFVIFNYTLSICIHISISLRLNTAVVLWPIIKFQRCDWKWTIHRLSIFRHIQSTIIILLFDFPMSPMNGLVFASHRAISEQSEALWPFVLRARKKAAMTRGAPTHKDHTVWDLLKIYKTRETFTCPSKTSPYHCFGTIVG